MTSAAGVSDDDLPEFLRPPVREVAIGLEIQPLRGLRAIQLGPLWDLWREAYPQLDEQPPLPPPDAAGQPLVEVTFGPPPINRHWFFSADGRRLVQLQADRLALNWRAVGEDDEYPRYTALREEFIARAADLDAFLGRTGRAPVAVSSVELSYVNVIRAGDDAAPRAADVLRGLTADPVDPDLGPALETHVAQTFRAGDGASGPLWLNAVAAPGRDPAGRPVLQLSISVRGSVDALGVQQAMVVVDAAHGYLVRGFAALTRPAMHERWVRSR